MGCCSVLLGLQSCFTASEGAAEEMLQCCAKSSHFLPRCAVTALRYLGVGGRGASAQALSGRPGEVVCGAGRREDKHVAQPSAKHAVVPRRECSEDEVHDADVCADADDEDLNNWHERLNVTWGGGEKMGGRARRKECGGRKERIYLA